MSVISAIEQRREITCFKENPISDELLDKLVQALYLSPSRNNFPFREFILITEREMLVQLSTATPYMKWLDQASAGMVIIGNKQLSKYWLQNAAISGGFLWLAATSLEHGAAWGAIYHSEDKEESAKREGYVRNLLQIPNRFRIVAIVGSGYPANVPAPKQLYPLETVFQRDTYKNKDSQR